MSGGAEDRPGIGARLRNFVNIQRARSLFKRGAYARALTCYRKVGPGKHAAKARQMIGWIDYKLGAVAPGWPVYPGTGFAPDAARGEPGAPDAPILVRDHQKPHEAIAGLGLQRWTEDSPRDRPLLVWYNFKASLGIEVLATKIVKAFQRKFGLHLVLVTDPRVAALAQANFPDTPVLSRDADMAVLRGKCSHYIQVRDVLAHMVRSPADFDAVAAETLATADMPGPGGGDRPRVAISWKTTNKRQGPYRNIPLAQLADLLAGLGIEFHSAQHGVTDAERALLETRLGPRIRFDTIHPSGSTFDIACQLRSMDAVATIDNSVLLIAGSVDMPAFGLLSVPAHWLWPLTGQGSRWFRSVRLIHQQTPRRWDGVLEELRQGLQGIEH